MKTVKELMLEKKIKKMNRKPKEPRKVPNQQAVRFLSGLWLWQKWDGSIKKKEA